MENRTFSVEIIFLNHLFFSRAGLELFSEYKVSTVKLTIQAFTVQELEQNSI